MSQRAIHFFSFITTALLVSVLGACASGPEKFEEEIPLNASPQIQATSPEEDLAPIPPADPVFTEPTPHPIEKNILPAAKHKSKAVGHKKSVKKSVAHKKSGKVRKAKPTKKRKSSHVKEPLEQ